MRACAAGLRDSARAAPAGRAVEVDGGVDQPDVAERLREVADEAAAPSGRTPRRAARRRCAGASSRSNSALRLVRAGRAAQGVGEPERAGRNAPSPPGRPSTCLGLGAVAEHEPVVHELALDRRDGAAHPRSSGGRNPTSGIMSRLASSSLEP